MRIFYSATNKRVSMQLTRMTRSPLLIGRDRRRIPNPQPIFRAMPRISQDFPTSNFLRKSDDISTTRACPPPFEPALVCVGTTCVSSAIAVHSTSGDIQFYSVILCICGSGCLCPLPPRTATRRWKDTTSHSHRYTVLQNSTGYHRKWTVTLSH
jgi:hypothetical protein